MKKLRFFSLLPLLGTIFSCGYVLPEDLADYIESLGIYRAQSNVLGLEIEYLNTETDESKGAASNTLIYKGTNALNEAKDLYYYCKRETTGYFIPNFDQPFYEIEIKYDVDKDDGSYLQIENGVTSSVSQSVIKEWITRLFYVDGISDAAGDYYVEGGFYYGDYISRYLKFHQFMTLDEDGNGLTYATGNTAIMDRNDEVVGYHNTTYHLDKYGMLTDYDGLVRRKENNVNGTIKVTGLYTYKEN